MLPAPVVSTSMRRVPCPLVTEPPDVFQMMVGTTFRSPPIILATKTTGSPSRTRRPTCASTVTVGQGGGVAGGEGLGVGVGEGVGVDVRNTYCADVEPVRRKITE